jgi:hypothetical protein
MLFLGRIVSRNRVLSTGLAAAVLIEYNAYGTRSATTEPWRPFSNPKPPTSPPRSAPTAASVFAAVFSIIGLWPLMRHDTPHRWALGIAVAFALAAPHLLGVRPVAARVPAVVCCTPTTIHMGRFFAGEE